MKQDTYDVIVVGARVAGSPTAMLLARRGYRVLMVDKATFPSGTISTHNLTLAAMASLQRWGLYDRVAASDCLPTDRLLFDMEGMVLEGWSGPLDGISVMYNVRRDVLDNLLVEAAVEAGAEFRQGCSVDEIIVENGVCSGIRGHVVGGSKFEARAPIVVGADGRHSRVAAALPVDEQMSAPALTYTYYSYFSGLDLGGRMEVMDRAPYTIVAQPTSHGRAMVAVLGPASEFQEFRKDIETNFENIISLVPEFHARWKEAQRDERFAGTVDVQNIVRVPYGPGFALVGDSGLHQDPTLGQGITNAFRDAEILATAIDLGLSGRKPMTDALRTYHEQRDAAVLPMHELVVSIASHEPPTPEVEAAFGALPGNQRQIDRFFGVMLGTVRVEDFFSPGNLAEIVEEARSRERELVAA